MDEGAKKGAWIGAAFGVVTSIGPLWWLGGAVGGAIGGSIGFLVDGGNGVIRQHRHSDGGHRFNSTSNDDDSTNDGDDGYDTDSLYYGSDDENSDFEGEGYDSDYDDGRTYRCNRVHRGSLPNRRFGVELEMSSRLATRQEVASTIRRRTGVRVQVSDEHSRAHENSGRDWKIVPDSSVECRCGRRNCRCDTFELVSPILRGERGLRQCKRVLLAMKNIDDSNVNRSMGFHVHVNVEGRPQSELIKLSQNFIKYESAMDSFMPRSRRTGSPESNRFSRSNRSAVSSACNHFGHTATNRNRNNMLAACDDLDRLSFVMNQHDRYYKLNLQNLVNSSKPTVEFRQHAATTNFNKVDSWVRFCVTLVENSARLTPPRALREGRETSDEFGMLFQHVIKDGALKDFYANRRAAVSH